MHWWFKFEGAALPRRLAVLVLLLGSVLLPFLAREAAFWQASTQALQTQLVALERHHAAAAQARQQLTTWIEARDRGQALARQVRAQGRSAAQWQQHSVEVQGKRYSRQATDLLLMSLKPSADAFMVADNFSLKLADGQHSLLVSSSRQDDSKAVLLSLKGTYYSRSEP